MSNNYNQTTNTNIQSGRRHRRSTKYQHSLIIIQNYETKVNTQYFHKIKNLMLKYFYCLQLTTSAKLIQPENFRRRSYPFQSKYDNIKVYLCNHRSMSNIHHTILESERFQQTPKKHCNGTTTSITLNRHERTSSIQSENCIYKVHTQKGTPD